MNKFCKELPNNYKLDYTIDAKNKKTGIILNVGALILMAVVFIITSILKFDKIEFNFKYIEVLLFIITILGYMILHELVHGLFYKIFTKEKLTFGFSWSCAFCGVPNIYTSKKVSVIAALAPFIIFNLIFIPLIIILPPNNFTLLTIIVFSLHFGGCAGDLFFSILLLVKYDKNTLINDTGAKQTIYIQKK